MTKLRIAFWVLVVVMAKIVISICYEILVNETRKCFGLEPKHDHKGFFGGGGHEDG